MRNDSTSLEAVARRLDTLERQNRRLKHGFLALVLLGTGAAAAAGQAPARTPPLTADRFTLVDSNGSARAALETAQNGRGAGTNPELTFLDKDGRVVMRIGIGDRGPVLETLERDGKLHNFLGGPTVRPATQ